MRKTKKNADNQLINLPVADKTSKKYVFHFRDVIIR